MRPIEWMSVVSPGSSHLSPVRYTAAYAVLAVAWAALTELGVQSIEHTELGHLLWEVARSALFVAVSAVLVHVLLRRMAAMSQRAEARIRAEEQRWHVALDGVGDGMWDWKVATDEVVFSGRSREMLGYPAGEAPAPGGRWADWVHPDDRAGAQAEIERHLRGETAVYRHEHRLRRRDGGDCWVLDRGTVVERDAEGRALRMIGTHTDISADKALEAEVTAQAARYRMLFEQHPLPMWVYEIESRRILAVNDFAVQKYGYTREQFLAMTILDLRPPEEVPALLEELRRPRGGARVSGPWRHRTAGGEEMFVEIAAHSIVWEGRSARLVVAHDVTAERKAAQAREESEEKFRGIYETAHDAILLLDSAGFITDCNPRTLALFGAPLNRLIGRTPAELSPAVQPDGEESGAKAARLVTAAKKRVVPNFEWQHRRDDGTTFDCEITLSPVHWQRHDGLLAIIRDISERKRAMERLELLLAALRAAPAGIAITGAAGAIEWVNPAVTKLTGYTAEELIGQNPRIFRSTQQDETFYRQMWATITRGDVWSGELQNRRKDGTLYHERMTIAPVRTGRGGLTHFVAVKEDITSERQLEQQLSRAQRLESVGMLASGIAHDLNNVLTPIILTTELLKSASGSAELNARLDLVAQAALRGAGIVKQVLTFARGVEGERMPVQPSYVVKEVARLLEETVPRNIEIRVETGRQIAEVTANVTQLHQVLLNLAVNARDAMPSGGRLVLGVRHTLVDEPRARVLGRIAPGEFVDLSVGDTGTGISDEVLEHMFEPFYTTKPRGKGTGLGLSTVYGIVRSHGGAVEVETALGRGTTFHVLLPIPRDPVAAERPVHPAPEIRGDGRLVLLVDDEESIRIVADHTLRQLGFEVATAADGIEALGVFQLRPTAFSLVIVDQMMPRMGGIALIRQLRTAVPGLKIISSSGLGAEPGAEQTETEELSRLGVRTRLPKPYTSAELLEALRRELDGA